MALTRIVDGREVDMTAREEAEFLRTQAIPEPVRRVSKSTITQRLIAIGKIDDAYAALAANPSAFARWFSPDAPDIAADNAEAIAMLQAIGADPGEILA